MKKFNETYLYKKMPDYEKDIHLNTRADFCSHHTGTECAYP